MTTQVILPADAPLKDWEILRRSGLGGSDVAAACGLSPWKTPYQLWLEKTGRVEPEFDDEALERMGWGHKLEPLLLREFGERHDELILTGSEGTYADDDQLWMRANVDALAWAPPDKTSGWENLAGIVEIKTGNHRQVEHWADDQVPIYYVAQTQWYAHLLGAPRIYVAALLDTSTYVERVLERDDELIADLVELAAEFWGYVRDDVPPPVDGDEDTRKALSRWTATPEKVVELDRLWDKAITRRDELSDQIKMLTRDRDQLDNELRAVMGDAEEAYIGERKIATFRASSKPKRSADLDSFRAKHPRLYRRYVTESPASRRLTYSTRKDEV